MRRELEFYKMHARGCNPVLTALRFRYLFIAGFEKYLMGQEWIFM